MSKPFKLNSAFKPSGDQPEAIRRLEEGLEDGLAHQTLLGVTGSGKTFTIANVIADLQRPTMVLAPNKTLAAQLYGEMKEFFPDNAVEYFVSYYDYYQPEAYVPSSDTFIEKDASVNEHIEQMRLSATKALLERRDVVVVASVSAIYGLGDPDLYLKMMLHLTVGMIIDQRAILRRLAELQYTRNDQAFQRGTFRVRGEVIDIFPAESDDIALRVELFDEEVERLSLFDPLTGQVESTISRYTIYPKTHYVTPRERIVQAMEEIKVELAERRKVLLANNKLLEEQRLSQRTQFDLEMMNELGYCSGIENYSRYLSGRGPGERNRGGAARRRCLITCLPTACWWWMNPTSLSRKLAVCIVVTGRVKRLWSNTDSVCRRRWITVRLNLKSLKRWPRRPSTYQRRRATMSWRNPVMTSSIR